MMSDQSQGDEESREKMESLTLDDVPYNLQSPSDPLRSPSPPSTVDHPSYTDAIFTSFSSSGHNESPKISPNSDPTNSEYLQISVSDPQKEQDLSTYYTYLITTRTNFPGFGSGLSEISVRRRFKDVVALSDRLSESHRGFFVPIRPDKSVMESQVMQKQEFVEQRRLSLEKYLRKLGKHPVIKHSEEFRVFLAAKEKLEVGWTMPESAVAEVAKAAKGGWGLLGIFKELRQAVANDWGGGRPGLVEDDWEFFQRKEKMGQFEQQLSSVSLQAEELVKAQEDIGETMGELGLAFIKLTKFETEKDMFESQRARAADMKNLATAAVKASRLYRELNAQTVKHLDTLHEYLGVMLVVNGAFSDRSSALLTVQTLSSELLSLHSRIEKLEVVSSKMFGGDKSRIRKIEELKETIKVTENAKNCAEREYEKIKENNWSELERLDKEKRNDFYNMLKGFVVNQAGYAEKMAGVWEKVAQDTIGYAQE